MAHININLIEKSRKEKSLSQLKLASLLGISPGHYTLIKQGKRYFTLRHIEILWRELGLELTNLIVMDNIRR